MALPPGALRLEWPDPATGKTVGTQILVSSSGIQQLQPLGHSDVVLYARAV